jgi:plasmid stability protein
MASLTVRNIPEEAKRRFRQVAAAHGRSMEEHMRQLVLQVGATASAAVREERSEFSPPARSAAVEEDDWVAELVRIANGAGEGVFDAEPQPLREFEL